MGTGWLLAVGGFVLTLLLATAAFAVRPGSHPDPLVAEPADRPLAAVVVNPTKAGPATRRRITEVCARLGWAEPLWLETTVADPGTGQARAAVERGADVVLACGGDGTVRYVAEVLAGTGVAMGLVPAGTGNLLARTLGTPTDVGEAAELALTGDDRAIDVGRVRVDGAEAERAFLVMAGTGFDAAIMATTPEALKVRVGPLAYVIAGLRAMRGQRTRVTLSMDGGPPLRRRSRTVVVGNCGALLGGLVLMPAAAIDDGRLDVVNLAPKGLPGWVAVAARVVTRRRRGHPRLEHWQVRSLVVTAEAPQPSQLDGDPIGDARELRVRVEPGALVVRVPPVA
ncbi:MAG TPA: diacylglycerol kinase family protein [Pseudonocardia sp.]|nr:diacylglycerol kinase family protein [Pseudonocardia sp.]